MPWLKSALLAAELFGTVAAGLGVLWTLILGVWGKHLWRRLPEPWDARAGVALLVFAVVSGLALYFYLLARVLAARLPPDAVRWHLATVGVLPVVAAVVVCWVAIATMRIGW